MSLLVVLIVFLLGLALILHGYRIFLVLLPAWGFFAGFWLGAEVTSLVLGSGFLATLTGWIVGLACGLLLAILSYAFYSTAVSVLAIIIGFGLGSGLAAAIFGPGLLSVLGGVVLAGVAAVLVFPMDLQRYAAIALMSAAGANAIILALLLLLGRVQVESIQAAGNAIVPILKESWLWLLVWIALVGAGIWLQGHTSGNFHFRREEYMEGWS